jgi:hypothetical protein
MIEAECPSVHIGKIGGYLVADLNTIGLAKQRDVGRVRNRLAGLRLKCNRDRANVLDSNGSHTWAQVVQVPPVDMRGDLSFTPSLIDKALNRAATIQLVGDSSHSRWSAACLHRVGEIGALARFHFKNLIANRRNIRCQNTKDWSGRSIICGDF